MSDRVLRGSRLGAVSYESDRHTEFAPRLDTVYDCPRGHATTMPFAVEAEIPPTWECRVCGAVALQRDAEQPEPKKVKPARTHWDMLLERRSPPSSRRSWRSASACCMTTRARSRPP